MKLTAEQIECIDSILLSNGIKYDDVKLEMMDHMASEIEAEIEATNNDFQIVYSQIFENWKRELGLSRGFFSIRSTTPKIVHSKLRNQMKMEVVIALVLSILLLISFQLVVDKQEKLQFLKIVKDVLFYSYFITAAIALLIRLLNSKTNTTSTYKYLFDARFTTLIIFLSIVINSNVPRDQTNQNLFVGALCCLFVFLLSIIYLGIKHLQFSRKLSIK